MEYSQSKPHHHSKLCVHLNPDLKMNSNKDGGSSTPIMIFPSSRDELAYDGRVMSDVVWYNSNGKSSSHCVYISAAG